MSNINSMSSGEDNYKWYHYLSLTDLIPQIRAPIKQNSYISINPPFAMPSDVAGLESVLDEITYRREISKADRHRIISDVVANFCSALTAGRLSHKVAILLIGETGQGKSTTINKLVGQKLLKIGRDESTTKEIDSVVVSAARNGISVALAFDDTPGLQDTTIADRATNAVIFKRYCDTFFTTSANAKALVDLERLLQRINNDHIMSALRPTLREEAYPNAIILAVRWDHVKHDAHNSLGEFATPAGRAIWTLHASKLFDQERPNIIFVVTRALTDPGDYLEDECGTPEFDQQWRGESAKKRKMIHAIQEKVFPISKPWPVVFVENGGNPRKFGKYDILPNGEQTHQNLFDALRKLFEHEDSSGARDLLGLQALATVLSGAAPHVSGAVETKTLQSRVQSGEAVGAHESQMALAHVGMIPSSSTPSSDPVVSTNDLNREQNAQGAGAALENNQQGFWDHLWEAVGKCVIQ